MFVDHRKNFGKNFHNIKLPRVIAFIYLCRIQTSLKLFFPWSHKGLLSIVYKTIIIK